MSLSSHRRHVPGALTRMTVLSSVLAAAALPAQAVVVSGTLDFSAGPFAPGAPFATVSGRVSYRFDNAVGFVNKADGDVSNGSPVEVSIHGVNLPGNWVPVLSYFKVFNGQPVDFFAIGHGPTTFVAPGTDDWRVAFNGSAGPATFRELTYAVAHVTSATFMSTVGVATPVPEPGTWAMAVVGLGLVGMAARRRRT
ncbi:MAG: PEPxxWA-CTERM sorting domain-containing protein [Aquabacterium sp.]